MVQIDDAGSGSLVGGTGIGVMRKETEEYLFRIIPPVFFREPFFTQKKYQQYVIKIVRCSFERLNVTTDEPIQVCRGYVFDALRRWLDNQGYAWTSSKIDGPLQIKVEESFSDYVIKLGLPRSFVQHARYAFGFHRLLKWVFADFENRSRLCKTGWKSWRKWSRVPFRVYAGVLEKEAYCLKCGQLINKHENAVILEYITNRSWNVPLHPGCCPYQLNQPK
ncbi:MAG: hypothetical protein QHH10_10500 [Peptococcaceae bacterium]|jgi:hypothetical protein|nr:hypothetical protein [Peptococcaceae bacterium]MDH7525727.1 hypothetical protein [Peptococcaceae bacterium]